MDKDSPKFAILGAGNGGHAMAADLSIMGFYVNLFELPKFKDNIKPIKERGGIDVVGFGSGVQKAFPQGWPRTGFAKIRGKVTTDIEEAIQNVDVIEIVTPAFGHEAMINACAPYLKAGQIVVFNTGNWACLRFAPKLREMGIEDITLAETSILMYSCRRSRPGRVEINGVMQEINISALPAKKTSKILEVLHSVFPQLKPAKNVLQTSLENVNIVNHPPLMILNTALVEHKKGDFLIYAFGCSPSVAKIIEAVDTEKKAIAKVLGLEVETVMDWTHKAYGAEGDDVYERIQSIVSFRDPVGGRGPSNMQFRYITEDIPYGQVPLASLGDLLDVQTPTVDALIHLASTMNETDYMNEGTTMEKLGLTGLNAKALIELVS